VLEQNQEKAVCSITFFEYGTGRRRWAFNQMRLALEPIKKIKGIAFFKLLGTGGGFGFSLKPDFRTYALLIVWKDRSAAQNYTLSDAYLRFNTQCKSNFTYWMGCIQSHGTWGGINPFTANHSYTEGPVMVITRARLRLLKIGRFLRNVPAASRSAEKADGLIFTKGIGEWPAIEQATFSYWESMKKMQAFAYTEEHKRIITLVKKDNWYKEELFARFVPIDPAFDDGS
jgi:heme-degrading monooxygenase HmoA